MLGSNTSSMVTQWLHFSRSCGQVKIILIYNSKSKSCIFIWLQIRVIIDWLIVADESSYFSDYNSINDIDSPCLLSKVSSLCPWVLTEKVRFIRSCGIKNDCYRMCSETVTDSLASWAPDGM